MNKAKKRSFLFILFLTIFSFFVWEKWPDESMKVTFCDVGQGDSILIQRDFFQILIDSGKNDQLLGCLGRSLPVWDRTIEVIIMTHADEDHIGYFGEILGIYETKFIFFPDTPKNTRTVNDLKEAISQELAQGARLKEPILGQTVGFPSGGKVTFLNLSGDKTQGLTENGRSIVFLLEYQSTKWLFMGDLEEKGELSLLKKGLLTQVNVLKVGHHGAATSSTVDFLEATFPQVSVISVGKNNSYGHPTQLVLENLRKIGSRILRTDQLGDIELITENGKIWLQSTLKRE